MSGFLRGYAGEHRQRTFLKKMDLERKYESGFKDRDETLSCRGHCWDIFETITQQVQCEWGPTASTLLFTERLFTKKPKEVVELIPHRRKSYFLFGNIADQIFPLVEMTGLSISSNNWPFC